MWVKVLNDFEVRCVRDDSRRTKPFRYEFKTDSLQEVIGFDNNSPTETSLQSPLHRFLKNTLEGNVIPNEMDSKIISIKNELESKILVESRKNESAVSEDAINQKYTDLYTNFNYFLKEYDMTPLELIVITTSQVPKIKNKASQVSAVVFIEQLGKRFHTNNYSFLRYH